jgi:hypothetical protein
MDAMHQSVPDFRQASLAWDRSTASPSANALKSEVGGKLSLYKEHVVGCSGLSKTEISSGGRYNEMTSLYDNPRSRQPWPFWPALLSELSLPARTIYVTVRRRRGTRVARHHRSADSIIGGIDHVRPQCEFPAYRSHFVSGVMAPPDFRRKGATAFSA